MIIARFSVASLGEGVSVSKYVKIALTSLRDSDVRFETNAMSTIIEAPDIDTLFKAVKKAHNAVLQSGVKRVITELKIDERTDKNVSISSKIESLR